MVFADTAFLIFVFPSPEFLVLAYQRGFHSLASKPGMPAGDERPNEFLSRSDAWSARRTDPDTCTTSTVSVASMVILWARSAICVMAKIRVGGVMDRATFPAAALASLRALPMHSYPCRIVSFCIIIVEAVSERPSRTP